jgi:acyl-CoA thioester hydrolase
MSKHAHVFSFPVRVYYEDTDAGGVVYHASYVRFMERARTEWLRTYGYTNPSLVGEFGVLLVVRSVKVDYLRPAFLDDLLAVSAEVKDLGRSRVTVHQTVRRGEEVLAEGEVHLVCVTADGFKPVAVPEGLKTQWKV